jgi:hypothetical protein
MKKGMLMLLRSMGIEVSDEHVNMLTDLIPKLPQIVNDCIRVINVTISRADQRIQALEKEVHLLREEIQNGKSTTGDTTGISNTTGPATGTDGKHRPNGIGV